MSCLGSSAVMVRLAIAAYCETPVCKHKQPWTKELERFWGDIHGLHSIYLTMISSSWHHDLGPSYKTNFLASKNLQEYACNCMSISVGLLPPLHRWTSPPLTKAFCWKAMKVFNFQKLDFKARVHKDELRGTDMEASKFTGFLLGKLLLLLLLILQKKTRIEMSVT